jgi:hypothetical protein
MSAGGVSCWPMKTIAAIALALALSPLALNAGRPKVDPKLATVTKLFVSGNNQAAEAARQYVLNGKSCFTLTGKEDAADGVLALDADGNSSQGGMFGGLGGRNWVVSATLTLKSGDLAWSHSERWSDTPTKSGAKTSAELIMHRLADAAGCKDRR